MGQKPDQLVAESLEDGGLAPVTMEGTMKQPATSSFEPQDVSMDSDTKAAREKIDRTRGQMSETIDAISERLDPHTLAQQAKDAVRDATIGKVEDAVSSAGAKVHDALNTAGESLGGVAHQLKDTISPAGNTATDAAQATGSVVMSTSRSLTGTIRAHPMPAAVAGIGLGWLIWSARKESGQMRTVSPVDTGSGMADQRGRYDGQLPAPGTSDGQHSTANLSEKLSTIPDTTVQIASKARDGVGQVSTQIQDRAQQAQSGFQQVLRENPLIVGAVFIGLGALAGLAVPETEQENRLLGPTRGDLMEQATHTAQDTVARAGPVARDALAQAKQEVLSDS